MTLPSNQMMRCLFEIGPTSISFGVIFLVEMDQQRKKSMLALLQRQPDHPLRIPTRSREPPAS